MPPQWILYTLSGAIVMLMIWDNIVSHIAFNLVKKEIDGVEADNSEEVSTKVRQLLREDPGTASPYRRGISELRNQF